MKPGMKLKTSQIKGIINLVASSVENLKPENVTIVDDNGNILSTIVSQSLLQAIQTQTIPSPEITPIIKVITVETTKVATNTATKMVQKVVSEEERTLMKLKVVKETEEHYESLAQSLINRFYPPNSALIKVSLVLGGKNGSIESYDVKRVTAIVLVDNRFNLTPGLKQDTFTIVSQAIGYNEKRGDRIFIRKVPFQFAMTTPINPLPIPTRPTGHKLSPLRVVFELINWSLVGAVLVGLIFVMLILRLIRGRGKKQKNPEPFSRNRETAGARKPETAGAIDDFRALANAQPEKVADLLKSWLTENK
jgi:flagellar M-ring protein FliF